MYLQVSLWLSEGRQKGPPRYGQGDEALLQVSTVSYDRNEYLQSKFSLRSFWDQEQKTLHLIAERFPSRYKVISR